jgi:head-tail adaptor
MGCKRAHRAVEPGIAKTPAAQREVTNREIRFTVRFGTTITIAARPAPQSSIAWTERSQ